MAKLRGITKEHLTSVNANINTYLIDTDDEHKYRDAYKLMSEHKDIVYCYYWDDTDEGGMCSFSIERKDVKECAKLEESEKVIVGTNKEKIGMCGTSYEIGSINKIIYSKEYRYIVVYYYNKYRKMNDKDYLSCWGEYDLVGGGMSREMKAFNDKKFSDAINYVMSCMA